MRETGNRLRASTAVDAHCVSADAARLGDHGCFCCGALRGEKTQRGGGLMGWKARKQLISCDFLNVRCEDWVCAVVWEVRQYTALQQTVWGGEAAVDA
ncbi:hypothetical protein [Paraburkholderia flava]|uniref:hypothetical protein n=1 Tax=Paraburkholderia flava TaxID=2547393 RepID=UPI001061BE57|nr:hypothetical protein [Paraburkholderia flava]